MSCPPPHQNPNRHWPNRVYPPLGLNKYGWLALLCPVNWQSVEILHDGPTSWENFVPWHSRLPLPRQTPLYLPPTLHMLSFLWMFLP
eukprot:scaffold60256_cov55-Attheya_sp.AAC.5